MELDKQKIFDLSKLENMNLNKQSDFIELDFDNYSSLGTIDTKGVNYKNSVLSPR